MPMREPAKVSISPKATSTEESITPAGGMAIPATNSPHPKKTNPAANIS